MPEIFSAAKPWPCRRRTIALSVLAPFLGGAMKRRRGARRE
jgi:hypothetical protein